MKKYLFIIKTQVMSNLQYVFNIVVGFLGYFVMLFILFNLWDYLYSDTSSVINGYTKNQMIWYVIITETLWMTLGGRKLSHKISDDVRSGNITYNINKPYNYIGYCLSTHIGDILIKGIIYSVLGLLTGLLFTHSFPSIGFLGIILVLITSILALIISTLLITSLSLLSFFIEDASPFYWIYSKLILVLGTIFPIEYFPKVVANILAFSPVYVVSYGPAKLFVNFNIQNAISVVSAQIVYILLAYGLCYFIYQKGVKRINVNGG